MALLIGIIAFFSPLVAIPLLICYFTKIKWFDKRHAFPFAMIYGAIAYSFYPNGEMDLVRYFNMIERMQNQSLINILANDHELLYARDALFYFVGKTQDLHTLPFLVTTFVYYVAFYVSFDMFERMELYKSKKAKQYQLELTFLSISLVWTLNVISNVRNILAFMMIAFACYREFCEKKRGVFNWVLYIIPIGLHVASIALLLLRLLVPVIKKRKIFLIGALVFPIPVAIIYEGMQRISSANILVTAFRNMVNKTQYYLNWTSGGWADTVNESTLNVLQRLYAAGILLFFVFLLLYVVPQHEGVFAGIDNFLYGTTITALGCLYITTGALWRFEAVVAFLSAAVTTRAIKYGDKWVRFLLTLLTSSAVVYFILNTIRFFRYIYIEDFIHEFVFFSGIKVIIGFFTAIVGIIG